MAARTGSSLSQPSTGRPAARIAAGIAAAVLVVLGVLGFVPGVTTDLNDLGLSGARSGARLFGIFSVSVLQNVLHLSVGLVGLVLARTTAGARAYLVGGGLVLLLLWLVGLATGDRTATNFLPANDASNWLHLVLGTAMLGAGLRAGTAPPAR
nr:DUF4383 domain-containing protein [Micromonospora sp. DSM 115978]